jgi:TctA family transporter
MLSGGSLSIFVIHPISAFFMGAAFLAYMTPVLRWYLRRRRARSSEKAAVNPAEA